jgi:hypothetical protein
MKILSGGDLSRYERKKRRSRLWGLAVVISLIAAWIVGLNLAQADLMPAVREAMPQAERFEKVTADVYEAYAGEDLVGYVALGEASGYGGPLTTAVGVDPAGTIEKVVLADHRETPAWIREVREEEYLDSLSGKKYSETFQVGEDLDGVTGATMSSRGIAQAALNGSRKAAQVMGLPVQTPPAPRIEFGVPEAALLLLFGVGYLAQQRKFKHKKTARWVSLLGGLLVLGFLYNKPLTLAYINKLLIGFWPQWQTHLYWYLLIGGIIFVFTIEDQNPYCQWFCPFGAAQEVMGAIGGASVYSPRQFRAFLESLQRVLAWAAVVLALVLRNPGLSSFEIFGTLFSLTGSGFQFILLGMVLVASMFIKRPWCTYLCPLDPVVDFIKLTKDWIQDLWQTKSKTSAGK